MEEKIETLVKLILDPIILLTFGGMLFLGAIGLGIYEDQLEKKQRI